MSIVDKILREVTVAAVGTGDSVVRGAEKEGKRFVEAFRRFEIYEEDENEYYFFIGDEPAGYVQFDVHVFHKLPQIYFYTVASNFRGKGVASEIYDYFINRFGGMVSDVAQSKGDMLMWVKLFSRYKVKGFNFSKWKTFDVHPVGDRLEGVDPSNKVYGPSGNLLICMK